MTSEQVPIESLHHVHALPWHFMLRDDFSACERGCTLFCTRGDEQKDFLAYWTLGNDRYLRVCIVPESYPGIDVSVVHEEDFVSYMKNTYASWYIRHSNVEKLPARQYVVTDEEYENMDAVSPELRAAVSETLGRDVEDWEIMKAHTEHHELSRTHILLRLENKQAAFDAAGGRGVDLAEEIDGLKIALVILNHPRKGS